MKTFLTMINKHNKQVLFKRLIWTMQGDCSELNNLMKELECLKRFANGQANKQKLKLSDFDITIEMSNEEK